MKPRTMPSAIAARQTFSVASKPIARIGSAIKTMLQSIVWALSGQRRNRVRQVHVEAKPLLLQRMQCAVALELAQLLIDESDEGGVVGTSRNACPVVRADALDDRVFARRVLEHKRERRQRIEYAVDLALGERDVGGGMVVESLQFLETGSARGLQLRIEFGLERLARRTQ